MGGAALHFGWVAEMKTGEGKTLVSTLPAYLNGLAGKGVHLITVNDYLARRDAEWMGQIHRWLGPRRSASIIPGDYDPDAQARAVRLRHHLRHEQRVRLRLPPRQHGHVAGRARSQRGHSYAIVDEVDSILIDEARTPLIISGRVADAAQALLPVRQHRPRPPAATSTTTSTRRSAPSSPTEDGIEKVEQALGIDNLYDERRPEPRPPAPGRAARPRSCSSATRTTSSSTAR